MSSQPAQATSAQLLKDDGIKLVKDAVNHLNKIVEAIKVKQQLHRAKYEIIKKIMSTYKSFPEDLKIDISVRGVKTHVLISRTDECFEGNCDDCVIEPSDHLEQLFEKKAPSDEEIADVQKQIQDALMDYCVNASELILSWKNTGYGGYLSIQFSLRIDTGSYKFMKNLNREKIKVQAEQITEDKILQLVPTKVQVGSKRKIDELTDADDKH